MRASLRSRRDAAAVAEAADAALAAALFDGAHAGAYAEVLRCRPLQPAPAGQRRGVEAADSERPGKRRRTASGSVVSKDDTGTGVAPQQLVAYQHRALDKMITCVAGGAQQRTLHNAPRAGDAKLVVSTCGAR